MFHACDRTVTLLRRTADVLDTAPAATAASLSRQPPSTALLEATVAGGTAGTGTVTFTGLFGGAAATATLTFTGPASKTADQPFDSVNANGVTTGGLADEASVPTLKVRALTRGRQPLVQEVSQVTGYPAQLTERDRGRYPVGEPGASEIRSALWLLPWTSSFTPREEDVIKDDSESNQRWRVLSVATKPSPRRPNHWALTVVRDEGV